MKVKELVKWLSEFEDQDADVLIVEHESGTGQYYHGGNATDTLFSPEKHTEYTDFRGNKFVKPGSACENKRTLLLGTING